MPRPLSSFDISKYGVTFTGNTMGSLSKQNQQNIAFCFCNAGDYPLELRPKLLFLSMRIISACSILDSYIVRSFAAMLGDTSEAAIAIYQSLGSTNLQHTAIKAAAQATLSKQNAQLLDALLSLYKKRVKLRHRIAHHLWGYSTAVEDGILLIDPKDYDERQAISPEKQTISPSKISVYQEEDFINSLREIEELSGYFHDFYFMVGPFKNSSDERFSRLASQPPIQKELGRLFPEWKTRLEAQQQQQSAPPPSESR